MLVLKFVSFLVPQCFPNFPRFLDDIAAACSSAASSLSVVPLPLQLQHPLSFLMQGPPKPLQLDPSYGTMAAAAASPL